MAYSYGNLASLELASKTTAMRADCMKNRCNCRGKAVSACDCFLSASLGDVSLKLHDFDAARSYYQQSLDVRHAIKDRRGLILSTLLLGDVARETRQYDDALEHYQQALALCARMIWRPTFCGIQSVAELLMAQGRQRPALKLLAFVRAHANTRSRAIRN